jgi:hypothetical protein
MRRSIAARLKQVAKTSVLPWRGIEMSEIFET